MAVILRLTALIVTAFLGGCVYYPYETAFGACDNAAGACYQECDVAVDGDPLSGGQCRQSCDAGANQCFADAYDYHRPVSGYANAYDPWPWRGRYGYWRPDDGYFFSFAYGGRAYGRADYPYYGAPRRRYRQDRRRSRRDYRRNRRDGAHQGAGQTQPQQPASPQIVAPPNRSRPPARTLPAPQQTPPVRPRQSVPRATPRNRDELDYQEP